MPDTEEKMDKKKKDKAIEKLIEEGKLKIEEIDVLRLQKLMYRVEIVRQQHQVLVAKTQSMYAAFNNAKNDFESEIANVHSKYGLEEHHVISLSEDGNSGLVTAGEKPKEEENSE